ncbi:YggS family pyridoxal phosphate-dependent enzyme [Tenacibaculum finnmarkense genomovar ulcerans]|uniref:Pyridoxal phosphate homeostasis protein n=1 Tax=Tenacibaculum finnmarkense genomovar ulcerans TaxID=2781388 RepID=A0A2I2M698_9FLAO|nr:YggS family pyridoxal phosphate-dependent enzyme [Tenacibaculum finnmarkense genomovar ulcerans]MBE7696665.1 YggS family pyridoxal phosphate-dependent enzyme [Tenacibaculum finnmarkense genomovar ulcerans]SOU88076.1 Pyridoxal phosphate homeostasis protein (modular protein) [Tenacibaculum finnmarkense genomovar ulcerans]
MKDNNHLLFSYGTLQLEKVQIETYKRILKGKKDSLPNYKLDKLRIIDKDVLEKSGKEFHPIAIKTNSPNDLIEGTIFEISELELKETDKYEVNNYKRVLENFSSGQQAWVYVSSKEKPNSTISNNISKIRERIDNACKLSNRNPNEIKLLLATKTVCSERIKEALNCGETLIAENKVQEIKQKYNDLNTCSFEQHFIGHLQTNKIKEILKYNINCIQTIDRIRLAEKLDKRLSFEDKVIDVLIQVNTSNETSKFGIKPNEVIDFIKQVSLFKTLKIKGLMTIGLFSSDFEKVRKCFKLLKTIQQEVIEEQIPNVEMKELSMGMSGDLEIAIEEGATIIRTGTAIFGEREYPDSYYWNENE